MENSREPRIVFWDLETMPDLREVMKVLPRLGDYPGLTLKASINSIICFGYKIFGEKTKCVNAWDFPDAWAKDVNNDYHVVKAAYKILREADVIVTFNGKRFDWKFLQTRLMKHGFAPLHKIAHIDLCNESKRNLYLLNNRLGTVSKFLVNDDKIDNGGWDLWVKVRDRDEKAQGKMTTYCIQDVDLLPKIFKKMKPLIKNIPNYNLFTNSFDNICPNCGSTRIHPRGYSRTKTKTYRRYCCKDCGTFSQTNAEDRMPKTL